MAVQNTSLWFSLTKTR